MDKGRGGAGGCNFAGVNHKTTYKIMEENQEEIIYDLEHAEASKVQRTQKPESSKKSEKIKKTKNSENDDKSDNDENDDNPENSENGENGENSENDENADNVDATRAEIERMVEEIGSETLLSIIKDNRNAAIRQIISEVEAARESGMHSGLSADGRNSSIFDLAAMA